MSNFSLPCADVVSCALPLQSASSVADSKSSAAGIVQESKQYSLADNHPLDYFVSRTAGGKRAPPLRRVPRLPREPSPEELVEASEVLLSAFARRSKLHESFVKALRITRDRLIDTQLDGLIEGEAIGAGSFGSVRHGKLNGQDVAVKRL